MKPTTDGAMAMRFADGDGVADFETTNVTEGDRSSLLDIVLRDPSDGILVVDDRSGAVLVANHAVRHYLGFDPPALIGTPLGKLEQSPPGGTPLLDQVHAHGGFAAERELRRIDGSCCRMHVRASAASWRGRRVIVVRLRDDRDRKRVEGERREAEAKYRSIFEHAIEGIFQTSPDGTYLSANPALARMYGYPSTKALIAGLTDIAGQLYVDPSRRAEFRRLLETNDAVRGFESEIRRADGGTIWISENARAVRDRRGILRYYEGTVVDISQRKRAEQAQRDEADVAGSLAEVGRELMASINSPGILERLCQLSAAALGCDWAHTLVWEATRDEYVAVSSTTPASSAPPASVPRSALGALLSALEADDVLILDAESRDWLPAPLRALHQGCTSAIYFAIRRANVCVGVLMAGYRVRSEPFTEVQRRIARGMAHLASVALEHARVLDELERANRIKSEFLATVSHELRTPLNVILGYNQLLEDEEFGTLTPEQADALGRVTRNACELLELINATLDLTRLEAGAMPIELGSVVLSELFHQIEVEAGELLREKPSLALAWDLAADLPPLQTDRGKLKMIVKNLIHNAVKFTDHGTIEVIAAQREDGVEFRVRDTGIGMSEDTLAIIFEPFRQADGSMTRRHGGVGLGLHLVKRLAEVLGGWVGVESRLGEGSTFRFWLPQRVPSPSLRDVVLARA